MEPAEGEPRGYRFGVFEVDLKTGELSKGGLRVRLQEQPFRVLSMLLGRPAEVVTREELRRELWPETFVDFEQGLNNAVKRLREALGDSADNPRFVETIPRIGYRFIAPAEPLPASLRPETPPTQVDDQHEAPGAASSLPGEEAPAAPPEAPFVGKPPVLRHVLLMGLAVAALLFAADAARRRPAQSGGTGSGRPMLVVLPFENLTGDPQQEAFTDGLTEEMSAEIGRLQPSRLGVIARTSAMRYKTAPRSVDEIGRELRVDYVLEGSVRQSGRRVRVTAQLIQVSDQTHLWSESYEAELRDVLTVQARVAQAVAQRVRLQLSPQQEARLTASPPQTEAYSLYVKGRYFFNKTTREGFEKAVLYFRDAIARDPRFAPPYAGMADCYLLMGQHGLSDPGAANKEARRLVETALELDDTLVDAYVTLAALKEAQNHDWPGAEAEYRRALDLNANSATAHHRYALLLAALERFDEAREMIRQAQELDPLSPAIGTDAGMVEHFARRYDDAIAQYKRVLEVSPDYPWTHQSLAEAYHQKRMYDAVIDEYRRYFTLLGAPELAESLRATYAASGYAGAQRMGLQVSLERPKDVYVSSFHLGVGLALMGRKDEALAALETAVAAGEMNVKYLKVDPELDSLRGEPHFQALLKRLGLE